MTVKLTRLGGTDWVDGDVLYAADQNDTITKTANEPWFDISMSDTNINSRLIKFSATVWNTSAGKTSDSGVTWAAGGFGNDPDWLATTFTGGYGVAVDREDRANGAEYSVDSGANWTTSSTIPPSMALCRDISMPSATVAVCCGTQSGGTSIGIWYTANGGDDWTQSASGPADCHAVDMASATIGYAVDSAGNIYKTTDSGVNWTDTTDDVTTTDCRIYAVDTDTLYIYGSVSFTIETYVNSTNTVSVVIVDFIPTSTNTSNMVKATNGNYYFLMCVDAVNLHLVKFDGTTVSYKTLGFTINSDFVDVADKGLHRDLIEVSDVLYCTHAIDDIIKINVDGDEL